MCSSRKYPYYPHRREMEIPGGWGVLKDPKLSRNVWNLIRISGGVRDSYMKSLPWGRYGYFMELHSITLPAAQIVENIKHTFPSSPYFPQELACYGACIVPEHKSHPLHVELLNVSPSTGRSIYSFPHLDQNPSVNPVSMHPVNSEYAYLPSKRTEF